MIQKKLSILFIPLIYFLGSYILSTTKDLIYTNSAVENLHCSHFEFIKHKVFSQGIFERSCIFVALWYGTLSWKIYGTIKDP